MHGIAKQFHIERCNAFIYSSLLVLLLDIHSSDGIGMINIYTYEYQSRKEKAFTHLTPMKELPWANKQVR